jgi:hypothetical protein
MTQQQIKLGLMALALFAIASGPIFQARAYEEFLKPAAKFGAKDCLFCHQQAEGGEGWNARGQWLLDEKERRKADEVYVHWLEDYKEKDEDKDKKKVGGVKNGR